MYLLLVNKLDQINLPRRFDQVCSPISIFCLQEQNKRKASSPSEPVGKRARTAVIRKPAILEEDSDSDSA